MNIPESAIRPFEPLGIPKLNTATYERIDKALDDAFHSMNHFGKMGSVIHKNLIDGYLRERMIQAGAHPKYTFVNKWFQEVGLSTGCHVNINYVVDRKDLFHQYHGLIQTKAGFL